MASRSVSDIPWFSKQLAVLGFGSSTLANQEGPSHYAKMLLALQALSAAYLAVAYTVDVLSETGTVAVVDGVTTGELVIEPFGVAIGLLGVLDRHLVMTMSWSMQSAEEAVSSASWSSQTINGEVSHYSFRLTVTWLSVAAVALLVYFTSGPTLSGLLIGASTELLPVLSLVGTAFLLWADAAIVSYGTNALIIEAQEVQAQSQLQPPPLSAAVDELIRKFATLAKSQKLQSQRWSQVLLVQILIFVCSVALGVLATWRSDVAGDRMSSLALTLPVLWPLFLSFAAVVYLNREIDRIPLIVTEKQLFNCVERTAFAGDYERLGLKLSIYGVTITTQLIGGVLLSGLASILLALAKHSME
jgi:hypothetical protein